jgi:hypothetical protein
MNMANWRYQINLSDLREQYEEKKMTIDEFGKKIAERFRAQSWFEKVQDDIDDILGSLECIESEEDFNNIIEELYDWGDTTLPTPRSQMPMFNKMCWIGLV